MSRTTPAPLAVLTLAAALGGVLAVASPASAAGVSIHVKPSSGLAAGDTVTVTATGLPGQSSIDIAECQLAVTAANPANPGPGCASDAANVMTSKSGKFPATTLTIHTGRIGSDPGSVCNRSTNGACGIVIASHGFGTIYGKVKITFGSTTDKTKVTSSVSKATVPAGKRFDISGRVTTHGAGVNGLKLTAYKRSTTQQPWAKVKGSTTTTKSIKGHAGSYAIPLKGFTHLEQYEVRQPKAKIAGTTYKASIGKVITIRP